MRLLSHVPVSLFAILLSAFRRFSEAHGVITIVFPLLWWWVFDTGTLRHLSLPVEKSLPSECGALLCRRKSFAGYDDSSNGRFKRRMLHLAISAGTISIWLARFPLPSSLTRPTWGSYVCNLNVVSREGETGPLLPWILSSSPLPLKRFNPRRFVSIPSRILSDGLITHL